MLVEYDSDADAVYVALRTPRGTVETDFIDEARDVDYDADGNVVGVELLGVSQGIDLEGLPEAERIAQVLGLFLPRSES
jgi:uncharacterized protein YuzE